MPTATESPRDRPGVDIVGAVSDVYEELARAHVCIAPIRYGGGTRVKILEAFAYGVPAVSTALGCAGLDVVPNVHLLVADNACGLARACAQLIRDDALAGRLIDAGHALYSAQYRDSALISVTQRIADGLLAAADRRTTGGPADADR